MESVSSILLTMLFINRGLNSFSIFLYFIPTFIAYNLRHDSKKWVLLINIIFGWTILGWFFCIFWAAFGEKSVKSV